MYCITDEQVAYILNDIRRNGVEMEDLQLNLLDHICCIMEQELNENDDFELLYPSVLKRFYNRNLKEIEDETINLLTFKNYYAMKKLMIVSGAISVFVFCAGSLFKAMHWPGAGIMLTLGIAIFSLLFLPVLFVLKSREVTATRDKIVVALGVTVGILFSMATLFTVMHWPGSRMLWLSSFAMSGFVLLPAYFFTGIRRPETRVNTILMSVLLVGATGLHFTLLNLRPSGSQAQIKQNAYIQNEQLLARMQQDVTMCPEATAINTMCTQIKGIVLKNAIGRKEVPPGFDTTGMYIEEGRPGDEFVNNGRGVQLIANLRKAVAIYNKAAAGKHQGLTLAHSVLEVERGREGLLYSNVSILNSMVQLQMALALSESRK